MSVNQTEKEIQFSENTLIIRGVRIRYSSICSYHTEDSGMSSQLVVRSCAGAVLSIGRLESPAHKEEVIKTLDNIINKR